ncbi:MAG: DNA-directed RNA polymerase subunit beta [Dehalococcoidia bacterium]|nr:MAG: DNA-directed RNA polymerase subunit beta [Dehalococcoidia bacterium]
MLKHKLLKSFAKLRETLEIPDLIHVQLDSFRWFQEEGLRELFEEISPIQDYTGNRLELHFVDYEFREPLHSISECLERGLTYSSPIHVTAQLVVKETGEIKQQELYFSDFPLMTDAGTFIISGVERVVVNQLTRFPGVYFTLVKDPSSGRKSCSAKLVAEHGAWLDFDTSNRDVISVKVSGKRKIPITTLLRVIGFESDEALFSLFQDVDNSPEHAFLRSTIERDPLVKNKADALFDIYRKLSSGEAPSLSSAQALLNNFLFNPRRYSLGKVGRYKLNKKLGLNIPGNCTGLTPEDLVQIVRRIISVNLGKEVPDDIDHLGNRRAQAVGFLIQKQFRIGLLRLERAIKERMSILGPEAATPAALINIRPVAVAIREFFGRSQLSQFMDQTNPLAELTHKRRLSAMGPGGLSRKQAGFEVRDVHPSHYGRICPIETPEGPNIGLIGSLATYASVNEYGFIETPYIRVIHEVSNTVEELMGRTVGEDIDSDGTLVAKVGTLITKKLAQRLSSLPTRNIKVAPFVSSQIVYLAADEEGQYAIAQANAPLNERNEFVDDKVEVKRGEKYFKESIDRVNFIDVSPKQLFSIAACLIPFLEHDDANRALMGCNMQRQAVPLLRPECPLVATGMEREVAKYSGQVIFAPDDAVVTSATSSRITINNGGGEEQSFDLIKFARTNQGTCINQRPIVNKGDKVKKGQVLVDSFSLDGGNLALGRNVLCAFMSWEGCNFEDAIVISRRLVKDDVYTSVHIEKYEVEERDTKLGPEEITRDIPNVNEESLANLDEIGIVHIGAEVKPNDILVGKITPKGETEPSAEEKLLRAIFGEKTREVKDSSLRMPSGEWGRVIRTKVFSRDKHDELPAGVNNLIQVWVAQKRKISVGDKMSGRHGNKGVISTILPEEDMPFLPDGTPVDIILNPLGVPSRMNIGQILEAHLGWAAQTLGFKAINPIFDGADALTIEDALARTWIAWKAGAVNFSPEDPGSARTDLEKVGEWLSGHGFDAKEIMDEEHKGVARKASLCLWLEELGIADGHQLRALSDEDLEQIVQKVYKERKLYPPIFGKMELRDGRTGKPFDKPITVGNVYIMKLIHLVGDKVHARSTGPYSLITQQPLGGKAQFGGQRFGEMEVWALEGYGAAHTLQEMLTIKSDDVMGRAKAYEALVKGEDIQQLGIPESTKVLFMELRSLGFAVELLSEGGNVSI